METPPEKSGINRLLRGRMKRKSPGAVETENVLRRCRKFNICPAGRQAVGNKWGNKLTKLRSGSIHDRPLFICIVDAEFENVVGV